MNTHPMKYVSMIKVLLRVKDNPKFPLPEGYEERLGAAETRLIQAATEEAAAYGEFHDIIKELAPSNELAAAMVKQTYLDLT